ncbi:hypothetical protein SAMN04488128_1021 [Chitinophaga eiseniae]|uniref:Transposase n=1 Tax=Chitinophaga eiseniae TaxID=634771 RepID=A0A1T4PTV2_9BACT|nr:hypothetical protein SAMN04488128_1021 [Chitinophaga eiseniae]
MLFEQNIGPALSIDETAFSSGELYTIVTNKLAKGRKGSIVAMIKGTQSEFLKEILFKIPKRLRDKNAKLFHITIHYHYGTLFLI